MNIEKRNIKDLSFYPGNPRKISDDMLLRLRNSIKEFGMVDPLIINKGNEVIGGNQRLKAAMEEGIEEVPVVIVELSKDKEKVLNLALNKIQGEWDEELLKEFIVDLSVEEIELTGFENSELRLMGDEPEDRFESRTPEEVPSRVQYGEICQLGRHKLMCGDASKKEDLEKLLDGHKVDICIADPPYGVNIVRPRSGDEEYGEEFGRIGKGNLYHKIIGDESTDTAKTSYLLVASMGIKKIAYWGGNYFTEFLPPTSCWIVWDKREELIPSNNFADCEIVWLNVDKPARIFRQLWSGWSRSGERKEELLRRIHPTQKPVGIHIKILEYISDDEESVLDLFSGSGPTLIACEWLNRTCYTMEIDPHYCDVIIDRWETYAGQKAIKL